MQKPPTQPEAFDLTVVVVNPETDQESAQRLRVGRQQKVASMRVLADALRTDRSWLRP